MCRFPVDSDGNGVVTIPLDECIQEWELGVLFSFHGKLCLGVKAVDMLKNLLNLARQNSSFRTFYNMISTEYTFQILEGRQGRRTSHVPPSLPPPLIFKAKFKIFVTSPYPPKNQI